MKCPHTNLVRDTATDDVICTACGLVLRDDQIPGELFVEIPVDDTTLPPSVTRGISAMCSTMQLCNAVREEAFRMAKSTGLTRRHDPSLAACIYIACRNLQFHRTQHEFESALGIPRKALGRAISRQTRSGSMRDVVDDVPRMLPRFVSTFTRAHAEICPRALERGMLASYDVRWGKMCEHRQLSLNSAIAKSMLDTLQTIVGDRLSDDMKRDIKRICGVRTI